MERLGWIKLHRKIQDHVIYSNHKALHCWIECLLRARHKEKTCYLKRKKVHLMPGQFVLGREEFAQSVHMSASTAWYWITQFDIDNLIDIKKTTKGSIVTILKWKDHQILNNEADNKKTSNEQQMNTNKNVKNVKKKRKSTKKKKSRFKKPSVDDVQEYVFEKGYKWDAGEFYDFYESKGWMVGKNKMKDWKAAVRNWERNCKKFDKGDDNEEIAPGIRKSKSWN